MAGQGDSSWPGGKFLFLSGVRREEYARAISLFVGRFASGRSEALLYTLPRSVQKADMSEWPAVVIDDLRGLGVNVSALRRVSLARSPTRAGLKDRIVGYLAIGVFALAFLAFMVGAAVGVRTIVGWFGR